MYFGFFQFQVDFDAPLGYKEPERHTQHEEPTVKKMHSLPCFVLNVVCTININV